MTRTFPAGFRWGCATAAYQIEGAATEDGRGPSIWDTFSHVPGNVLGGDTGDVACDHYHRMADDIALVAKLGLSDYRFSIAWPRVVPSGAGTVNPAGLDFYSRLVDELLSRNIRPVATLYHWDLPQPLSDAGGWTNRDTSMRFAEFAAVIAEQLGDRIATVTTLNEPWCSAYLGYAVGLHAPGTHDRAAAFAAVHHLLLAHGLGVRAVRAAAPAVEVSISLNPAVVRPATAEPADCAAAERAEVIANRAFLDPLLQGRLPDGLVSMTADVTDWAFVHDGDLELVSAPIDILGVNYYTPTYAQAVPSEAAELLAGTSDVWVRPAETPMTGIGWHRDPSGLHQLLTWISSEYGDVPMMVTENGAAYPDEIDASGAVNDTARVEYLIEHLEAVHQAISDGVDVRGYFAWSLLDNFEWAWGYSQRFGLVHVDFATQQRTPKRSAGVLAEIASTNALP